MIYTNNSFILQTKTPTVQFDHRVPVSFINEFIKRMGKNQIRVYDYQGNELKIHYNSEG